MAIQAYSFGSDTTYSHVLGNRLSLFSTRQFAKGLKVMGSSPGLRLFLVTFRTRIGADDLAGFDRRRAACSNARQNDNCADPAEIWNRKGTGSIVYR